MAYGLKYKTWKQHPNGDKIELRILQKDWSGSTYGIGALTGFSLQIQGDQSSLSSPIVKTSVNISLKDVFDRGTTQPDGTTCVTGSGSTAEKWGQWEEFYTNDPVKYRVDVVYSGGLTRNATIWSGFLTPDSWGEEMNYAGDIKLTARDMLGYLDEQEFDLTGEVSIQTIISTAITRSKGNMPVSFKTAECLYNSNGQSILAATIGASTYSGNTWYQALEKVLESLGLVLRYDGNGGFFVTSFRYLASHTFETHIPRFTGRSGYRTLDPAIKQIVETFNPKIEAYVPIDPAATDYTAVTGEYITEKIVANLAGGGTVVVTEYVPKYTLALPSSGKGYNGNLAVPAIGTPQGGAPDKTIYFPTDVDSGETAYFRDSTIKAPFDVKFEVDGALCEWTGTAPNTIIKPLVAQVFHEVEKVIIRAWCSVNGTQYGLKASGTWSAGTGDDIDVAINSGYTITDCTDGTDYMIEIVNVITKNTTPAYSAFLAPLIMSFSPVEGNDLAGEYKTTTIYNEANHNEITRTPSIGSATSENVSLPMVRNLLGYGGNIADDEWKFSGDSNTFPLAVMIHAQLLVYNGSENGNSIFTGNINDATRPVAVPATKYSYYQRNCILLSGAYDFVTGDVDSATLREVLAWEDVWDTFEPEYSVKKSRGEGGTSATGGGSSSGGSGGSGGGITPEQAAIIANMDSWFGYDAETNSIYIKKDAANNARNFYAFGEVAAGGAGSGGSGDSGALYSLVDVYHSGLNVLRADGTARQNGDALVYNATQGKWVAAEVGGGAGTVTSVCNVQPINGNVPLTLDNVLDGSSRRLANYISTSGGTITGDTDALIIVRNTNGYCGISYSNSVGFLGVIGFNPSGVPCAFVHNASDTWYRLLYTSSTPSEGQYLQWTGGSAQWVTTSSPASGYVSKSGDTMSGSLQIYSNGNSWNEGIRIHPTSAGWCGVVMCGSDNTGGTGTSAKTWSFHNNDGIFYLSNNGSDNPATGIKWVRGEQMQIRSTQACVLVLASSTTQAYMYYTVNGVEKASAGYYDSFAFVANETTYARIGITDTGVAQYRETPTATYAHNLFHAGIACTLDNPKSNAAPLYLSAGAGYGSGSGKYGVKVLCCDQDDAQSGLGQDCVGDLMYDFSICGGQRLSTYGYISFVFHEVNSTSYHRAGYFDFQHNLVVYGEVTAGSDKNWKNNIDYSVDGISAIMALKPATWDWDDVHGQGKGAGLIAQDVETVLPFAIRKNTDGLTLNYNVFHAFEISALQNHESRLEYLERENAELKEKLNQLTNRIWQN